MSNPYLGILTFAMLKYFVSKDLGTKTLQSCTATELSHSKTIKTLRNYRYLVKTTLVVYLIFYSVVFFETFIIFLETTTKVITGIFDFQK